MRIQVRPLWWNILAALICVLLPALANGLANPALAAGSVGTPARPVRPLASSPTHRTADPAQTAAVTTPFTTPATAPAPAATTATAPATPASSQVPMSATAGLTLATGTPLAISDTITATPALYAATTSPTPLAGIAALTATAAITPVPSVTGMTPSRRLPPARQHGQSHVAPATSFTYNDFSNVSALAFNGTASQAGSVLRLTTAGGDEAGSAFNTTPVDPAQSFHSQFRFSLHDTTTTPYADGIAFVLQASSTGLSALGRLGEGLGYGGISSSIEIEFDTYTNGWDPNNNHVAIMENGDETTHHALATPAFSLYGSPLSVWIDYDAPTQLLSVYVDPGTTKPATPLVTATINIPALVGTTTPAYAGFTGGTGADDSVQDILNWQFISGSSGIVPWHPHQTVRLSDHLSASVDLADGHLDLSSSDLSIPGRGPGLTLNHVWDSTLAQAGITSTAGQGWLTSLTQSMGGVLTQTVSFTDATGAVWPFAYTGSPTATAPYTSYTVPAGQPWQLTTSTAGYTLSNILTGEAQTFDAQGRYLADTDSYGNSNTLSYTSTAAMPMTETNSGGRALSLYYNTSGLLSAAQSPLDRASGNAQGQLAAYGYNASSQLTATAWGYDTRDQLLATYGYSGTQLVTVTTPYTQSPHAWVIGYDPRGRVSSLSSPVSGTVGQTGYTPAYTTTFTYTPGQTVVVEGDGTSAALAMTYTLDAQGEPIAVQDGAGDTTQTTYDADHDVLTSQDADGHLTQNFYQYTGAAGSGGIASVGQVTETLQPPISPDFPGNTLTPISTTHSYDPGTHDLSATVQYGFGALTLFGYDGHHSVVTTTQELGAYCQNSPPPSNAARRIEPSSFTRIHPDLGCVLLDAWRASVNQYDAYGERTGVTDGRGVVVSPTPDGTPPAPLLGSCPGFACATDYTHSYTYTAAGDLASASTPPLVTTQNGLTSTAPVTTSYGYDLDGNQSSVTSANGATTTYGYDHLGRAVSTTLPPVTLYTGQQAQPVETTGYDGDGNVVRQVDGNGDVTTSSYDPLGRLVATTSAVGGTTLYTYTATAKAQAQDPLGNVTTYSYDGAGRLIQSTDQLGDTTQTQYDQASNPLTVTTGTAGSVTQVDSRQYDALGRVVTDTVSGPGQAALTTVTSYDLEGNAEQIERPNGDVVFNSYDDVGQLLATSLSPGLLTGGAGGVPAFTTYQYDFAGNVETQTDADQRVTTATYDGDNRVGQSVAISSGSTLTTTTSYDPDGTAITQTAQSQAGSGPVSTRVTTATVNAADWTTSTGDGPTAGTGTGAPLVTAYQYDGAGQLRSQSVLTTTLPVTSVLNGDGLATAIGESVGATPPYTSAFGYTANDLPLTATLPGGPSSGIAEQWGYDGANRLVTATLSGPLTATNVLTSSYQYAYNPANWTTALTSVVSGITTTQVYTHDAEGRLTGRSLPGVTQSWSDDGNGNVLTATTTTTTSTLTTTNAYAATQANQLLSSTTTGKPAVYFGYDQHGDTTSITNTAGLNVGLSYDAQERPITLTAGSVTATLSYNAAGERAGYSVTVGSTPYYAAQFSYRGSDGEVGQAVIVSGTQSYTDTYLYTQSGAPLELIRQSASGGTLTTARYWYEEDGRGNVVALTDASGNVVDRYSYDAWGTLTSANEQVPQRLRYAGYWYDQEFGWYWVGVRYYDPPLGRWLAPDPSQQDGVHTYVYVGDDPIDANDPTGLGPDFLPPASWIATPTVTRSKAPSSDPLNVVISANSKIGAPALVADLSANWDQVATNPPDAKVSDCPVTSESANVGNGRKPQAIAWRRGGCGEFAFGGSHARAWPQAVGNGTAWFLAVSEEHGCTGHAGGYDVGPFKGIYHCIDSNGFNQGRDDFVSDVKAGAQQSNTALCALVICSPLEAFLPPYVVYNYTIEYRSEYAAGAGSDRVRYDGRVAIIKITAMT